MTVVKDTDNRNTVKGVQVGNLSDLKVKSAKPGKHTDGDGMYLLVNSAGKYWRMDYRFDGKRKTLALGVYPEVSLLQARQRLTEARQQLADGTDPSLTKRREKQRRIVAGENTFKAVGDKWLDASAKQRKSTTHARVINWMNHDIYPVLGSLQIGDVQAPDVLTVLKRMDARGLGDSVLRVKGLISRVMNYAVANSLAKVNPVDAIALKDHEIAPPKTENHAAILEPIAFGGLIRAIRGYSGHASTCNALKLAPLVFVRPGELRHAEWSEIDLDKGVWTVPSSKMKMGAEHIVPLSRQAVEILRQQQAISGHVNYVFPSIRGQGRPMSENTVNAALRGLGIDSGTHVGHGFRASARTMLDEQLKQPVAVIELQLAHAVKDANGKAYNRTSFLPERHGMMQVWADFIDSLAMGGDVVSVDFKRGVAA